VIWLLAFIGGFVPYALTFEPFDRDRSASTLTARWKHCTIYLERF